MDIIFLHDLRVDCIIGVWEWERKVRQTVVVDLDLAFDIRQAAASDALVDTLSYKDVAKRVSRFIADSRFQLVERMAQEVADILLGEFPIPWCRVRINKPGAIRGAGDVGVVIERGACP